MNFGSWEGDISLGDMSFQALNSRFLIGINPVFGCDQSERAQDCFSLLPHQIAMDGPSPHMEGLTKLKKDVRPDELFRMAKDLYGEALRKRDLLKDTIQAALSHRIAAHEGNQDSDCEDCRAFKRFNRDHGSRTEWHVELPVDWHRPMPVALFKAKDKHLEIIVDMESGEALLGAGPSEERLNFIKVDQSGVAPIAHYWQHASWEYVSVKRVLNNTIGAALKVYGTHPAWGGLDDGLIVTKHLVNREETLLLTGDMTPIPDLEGDSVSIQSRTRKPRHPLLKRMGSERDVPVCAAHYTTWEDGLDTRYNVSYAFHYSS